MWVDVAAHGASLCVSVAPCAELETAYRIGNSLDMPVTVWQARNSDNIEQGQQQKEKGGKGLCVPPHDWTPFCWDEPTAANKRLCIRFGKAGTAAVDIDRVHAPQVVVLTPRLSAKVTVELDGAVKVIEIKPAGARAPQQSSSSSSPSPLLLSRTPSEHVREQAGVAVLSAVLDVPEVTLSVVGGVRMPRELLLCTLRGVEVGCAATETEDSLFVRVAHAQIDNQAALHTPCPVVLWPCDPAAPFLSAGLRHQCGSRKVHCFSGAEASLAPFELALDEALIRRLLLLVHVLSDSRDAASDGDHCNNGGETNVANDEESNLWDVKRNNIPTVESKQQTQLYFEHLLLERVSCYVSVVPSDKSNNEEDDEDDSEEEQGFLPFPGILSVHHVPLSLGALDLQHPFCTAGRLVQMLGEYYRPQLVRQVWRLALGLDVLGAPTVLFDYAQRGLHDLIAEPSSGYQQQALVRGLSRGVQSFVKNSVAGVLGSASSLLGKVSEGTASMSGDAAYVRAHARSTAREPRDAGEGLVAGVCDLGRGVGEGLRAVLTEPVRGAQQDGLGGLARGLGRGLLGLGAKTLTGAVDFVAKTARGLGNTASPHSLENENEGEKDNERTVADVSPRQRRRPPRYVGADGVVRVYDAHEALGHALVQRLGSSGIGAYIAHAATTDAGVIALLGKHALLVVACDSGAWDSCSLRVMSRVPLSSVDRVDVDEEDEKDVVVVVQRKKAQPLRISLENSRAAGFVAALRRCIGTQ